MALPFVWVCMQVEVLNPDTSPAGGIPVIVEPGPVEGFTADNGMAKLTVNTVANVNKLTITVRDHSYSHSQ